MAAKAAQLAQWLKELQDKVNADGNIKYDDLSLIHISEPTRRRGISYAVFCLKKKKKK